MTTFFIFSKNINWAYPTCRSKTMVEKSEVLSLTAGNSRARHYARVELWYVSWGHSRTNFLWHTRRQLKTFLTFALGEVKWSEVAQSCPTLSDPTDCTLPGSCIHGILQARVLEWVAIALGGTMLKSEHWFKKKKKRWVLTVLSGMKLGPGVPQERAMQGA